jgi:hypothetical protein
VSHCHGSIETTTAGWKDRSLASGQHSGKSLSSFAVWMSVDVNAFQNNEIADRVNGASEKTGNDSGH